MTVYELIQELTYYDADMDIEFNVKLNEVDAKDLNGNELSVNIEEGNLDLKDVKVNGFTKGSQWIEMNFEN